MSAKRALIVDDSRSARAFLSRILERYQLQVDNAASAEEALDYLTRSCPDVIFMDHLMPGMDGFQALTAIKNDPRTATIPIMMYTSQEGELYVGQARALGAMGVLPKQVRPVDVSKVLYELHLLPDRRDWSAPALEPVEVDPVSGAAKPSGAERREPAAPSAEWGHRVEQAIKEQGVDLRRFVIASLDSFATRIISDVRGLVPAAPPSPEPAAVAASNLSMRWAWLGGIAAALIAALSFGFLWVSSRSELTQILNQVAALNSANAQLKRSQQDLTDTIKELSGALTNALPAASMGLGSAGSGAAGPASLVRTEPVPYGEVAMDRSRLDFLRDLTGRLESQGFRGVVRITSHAGAFCLSGNAADGYAPAPAATPLSKCDTLGNPFEESLANSQRQSVAFANLVSGIRQRSAGAISVSVENAGAAKTAVAYPARADSTSAGEWNKAAAANNRVEFAVEPGAG